MNRGFTNRIRIFMDNYIPRLIRDSRWFMYPFFWFWFKGKKVRLYMDFKKEVKNMSEEEFSRCYKELDCRATDRATDLNKASIETILLNLDKESKNILDVGCGRGYLLSLIKEKTSLSIHGCDVITNPGFADNEYTEGSILNLPFPDNAFDIVTCSHTIEHIPDIRKAISELKRVAKQQLIIVTPRQKYFYYTLDLHLHFFPEQKSLIELIDIDNNICIDCAGDWCYIATFK